MNKQKLSLCVIAGNVEKQIERFLDAFMPVADEVVIVSAIGNNFPDQTMGIAWQAGCKTAVYKNETSETIHWPHVDDFAAARNMAFSMASHDLIMWADTDDIISAESVSAIRELIGMLPDDIDGVEMLYDVPEDGIIGTNWRERIIRKGKAKWVSPIHEHLQFGPNPKIMRFHDAKIVHAQGGKRQPNNERNLRILESIPENERTPSHRFHLFQSLRACGRIDDAMVCVADILRNPVGMGQSEKYELFIAASTLAKDINQRAQLALQAIATDPKRREAYAEMALCMIATNRNGDALGYTTAMMALQPTVKDWNTRTKYYGWQGIQTHGMALRACGRIEEADVLETNHVIRSGAKISLLHASRGRADKAIECRRKWLNMASDADSIEHIFAIDVDDPHSVFLSLHRSVMLDGRGGPVAAWNAAASVACGKILVQLSDDWEPFYGWDTAILNEIGETSKPAVLAVSDGYRKDDLLCMAILNRARYNQQGYLFHPEFFSMCSDDWFTERAYADGVVIDARNRITFEHMHPAFLKGEMDETYARSNDSYHYKTGKGILDRLRAGIKVSAEMEGWFDFRDVYDYVAKTMPEYGTFVEVGSWKGKSAVYLRDRLDDLGKSECVLACVDTFEGDSETGKINVWSDFLGNCGARKIRKCRNDSINESRHHHDKSYDGIFIDAAHDYESVKADIAAWLPKVKEGGFFGGHDIDAPGVKQAVDEAGFPYVVMGRCWVRINQNQEP